METVSWSLMVRCPQVGHFYPQRVSIQTDPQTMRCRNKNLRMAKFWSSVPQFQEINGVENMFPLEMAIRLIFQTQPKRRFVKGARWAELLLSPDKWARGKHQILVSFICWRDPESQRKSPSFSLLGCQKFSSYPLKGPVPWHISRRGLKPRPEKKRGFQFNDPSLDESKSELLWLTSTLFGCNLLLVKSHG